MPSTAPAATLLGETAPGSRRRYALGLWIVASVFLVTMGFAAMPAPLYVLYQERDGFSDFTITIIFAAFAVGVVVSLFLAGHLSDRFGRRRVILPSLLLSLTAALLFLFWQDLPGLLIARFITGLGVGMLTATATAFITELSARARPGRSPRVAEVVATVANIGGLGVGPLLSGTLAEFAPAPLHTPFAVFAGLLLIGGGLLLTVAPETVTRSEEPYRYRPQRVVVPRRARGRYLAASLMVLVGFAVFAFFTSLGPAFVARQLGNASHVVGGLVTFVVLAASVVFQLISTRWARTLQFAIGIALLVMGIVLVVVSFAASSLPLVLAGGILAGAGAGVTFKASVGVVIGISSPDTLGEALAGLFLFGYAGMSIPVVLLGILLESVALIPAVAMFGCAMLALLLATGIMLLRTRDVSTA